MMLQNEVSIVNGEETMSALNTVLVGFAEIYSMPPDSPTQMVTPKAAEAKAYNVSGIAYSEKRQHDRAIVAFTKAIDLGTEFLEIYYCNRALACLKTGEPELAVADFSEALKHHPGCVNALYNRAVAYSQKGKGAEAIEDYSAVIQLNRDETKAYNNRGVAYQRKGEVVYAIQDYSMAIGLNPKFVAAYMNRGSLHLSRNDIYRALDDFHRAIKLDANAGLAYGQCGVIWCEFADWIKVKADWTVAALLHVDIRGLFQHRYVSIADFERKTQRQMPEHIVAMLEPKRALSVIRETACVSNEEFRHLSLPHGKSTCHVQQNVRLKLALKGYETDELSTGLAARLAGIPRSQFMFVMGEYGLSPIGGI